MKSRNEDILVGALCVLVIMVGVGTLAHWHRSQPITLDDTNTMEMAVEPAPLNDLPVQMLLDRIEEQEGFRSHPYRDTRGFLTIGFGTNLDAGITREAAAWLARHHLIKEMTELAERWPPFREQTPKVQSALLDFGYQLGVSGELGFHATLRAVENHQWEAAAQGVENSKWASETPSRAAWVAQVFREQK